MSLTIKQIKQLKVASELRKHEKGTRLCNDASGDVPVLPAVLQTCQSSTRWSVPCKALTSVNTHTRISAHNYIHSHTYTAKKDK